MDTAALESGEIHYMSQSPPIGEWKRLQGTKGVVLTTRGRGIPIWLAYNLRKKPLDDLKVRQAIAHLIDQKDISQRVYHGFASPLTGSYLSASWAYNPNVKQPTFDPEKGQKLLDEAGLTRKADGMRLSLLSVDSITLGFKETNQVLKENFKGYGIDLKLESIEWGAFTEKVLKRFEFDITLVGGPHGPDPDTFSMFVQTEQVHGDGRTGRRTCTGRRAGCQGDVAARHP